MSTTWLTYSKTILLTKCFAKGVVLGLPVTKDMGGILSVEIWRDLRVGATPSVNGDLMELLSLDRVGLLTSWLYQVSASSS
jgi:hypothetical protein